MTSLHDLAKRALEFRNNRDWEQFHNPKDMALSLVLEATEVLEHFQWKNGEALALTVEKERSEIGAELADVLYWVLLLSKGIGIDIVEAFEAKMKSNEEKYPVEKARGKSSKYDEL